MKSRTRMSKFTAVLGGALAVIVLSAVLCAAQRRWRGRRRSWWRGRRRRSCRERRPSGRLWIRRPPGLRLRRWARWLLWRLARWLLWRLARWLLRLARRLLGWLGLLRLGLGLGWSRTRPLLRHACRSTTRPIGGTAFPTITPTIHIICTIPTPGSTSRLPRRPVCRRRGPTTSPRAARPAAASSWRIRRPARVPSSRPRTGSNAISGRWARRGFDPTLGAPAPAAASKRSDYMRAQAACLEGRGYSVQ